MKIVKWSRRDWILLGFIIFIGWRLSMCDAFLDGVCDHRMRTKQILESKE